MEAAATIGGLLMTFGSILFMKGRAIQGIQVVILGNSMFALTAYAAGNIYGVITISIGIIVSGITWRKMVTGEFVADLKKDPPDSNSIKP